MGEWSDVQFLAEWWEKENGVLLLFPAHLQNTPLYHGSACSWSDEMQVWRRPFEKLVIRMNVQSRHSLFPPSFFSEVIEVSSLGEEISHSETMEGSGRVSILFLSRGQASTSQFSIKVARQADHWHLAFSTVACERSLGSRVEERPRPSNGVFFSRRTKSPFNIPAIFPGSRGGLCLAWLRFSLFGFKHKRP